MLSSRRKNREKESRTYHTWGKEGRKRSSVLLYGGGVVGKVRFDIPFEERWKVGGTNWGCTQSSLLCLQEKKLRKLWLGSPGCWLTDLWWGARLQHWVCPPRLWCSLYSTVMPVRKVNRLSLPVRTLPKCSIPYYKSPNTSCRGPVFYPRFPLSLVYLPIFKVQPFCCFRWLFFSAQMYSECLVWDKS